MAIAKQGFRLVEELDDEMVVSMIKFDGVVYIATERRVFRLNGSADKLVPIPFEVPDELGESP